VSSGVGTNIPGLPEISKVAILGCGMCD